MERFLADKPESMIIRAVQWLLTPLLSCWGDPQAFRRAGTPRFMREAGMPRSDAARAVGVVDQAYRQATRVHAQQFRPLKSQAELEYAYTRLVPTVTDSPARQGFLWLAFQAQMKALEFLNSERGREAVSRLAKAVDDNRNVFFGLNVESEGLTLAKIDRILVVLAGKVMDEKRDAFEKSICAGHIIEYARVTARSAPKEDLMASRQTPENRDLRMLTYIVEPVHKAELNEANLRFARINEVEKGRWFDRLRGYLNRNADKVSDAAPLGFENFCRTVESLIFPYPTQLEWIRAYLKPLYTNASQSSIFDNCLTEVSITQRYNKLVGESNSNNIMVELARAFALAKLTKMEEPGLTAFLDELNFREEFSWPGSLEELKAQQSA